MRDILSRMSRPGKIAKLVPPDANIELTPDCIDAARLAHCPSFQENHNDIHHRRI